VHASNCTRAITPMFAAALLAAGCNSSGTPTASAEGTAPAQAPALSSHPTLARGPCLPSWTFPRAHRLRLHGGDHARRWVRSHLSSTNLNRIQQRELRAYGSAGSYLARGTDVLAQAIFAGLRPAELGAAWGYESEPRWGTLRTASGARSVPSEQGAPTRTTTRSSPPPCAAGPRSRCPQPRRCAR